MTPDLGIVGLSPMLGIEITKKTNKLKRKNKLKRLYFGYYRKPNSVRNSFVAYIFI